MSVLVFLQYFEICHTTVDNIFLGAILLFVCEMNVNNRKILIPSLFVVRERKAYSYSDYLPLA